MGDRKLAIVRGGGDLATGIIYRLWKVGCKVLSLEAEKPSMVRRAVSAASSVFDGEITIEDMRAVLIKSTDEFLQMSGKDAAVLVDPEGASIRKLHPDVLVDAIMAKRNLGTRKDMAPLVIGIGPGFAAPDDVHAVIETKRGHTLGRVITSGSAIPNTGIPGMVRGYTTERVLYSPCAGFVTTDRMIGDSVSEGDVAAFVGDIPVLSKLDGILRGMIHPSVPVKKGTKIGDVDPRGEVAHCFTITDKALAIAGGVLEMIMRHENEK